jgi:uncharacterized protein (DUF983 family)
MDVSGSRTGVAIEGSAGSVGDAARSWPQPGLITALARGMTGRCGRCGSGGVLTGFSHLERCPRCGLRLDREEGFRAGALGVNTIVTFSVLAVVLGGGIALTMPDVPVIGLFAAAAGVAALLPIVGYPFSPTS